MSDFSFMILLALFAGVLAGFCAFLIKLSVDLITRFLWHPLDSSGSNWLFLIYPVVGLLSAYAFQKYVARQNLTHGTDQIATRLKHRNYRFRPGMALSSIAGSALTLGFGGSAGDEGPSAYSGAVTATYVGRLFRVDSSLSRILIGCGAAAGIAAIFKAPLGGALFTLEVIGMPLTTMSVMALLTSCLVAALTTYILVGCTPDLTMLTGNLLDASSVGYIVLFGVLCGLYSLYYSYTGKCVSRLLSSVGNNWMKTILAGAFIAVAVFFFPSLYGPGYGSLNQLFDSDYSKITSYSIFATLGSAPWLLTAVATGIILCKGAVCSATNNGNGVAGDFAPTLFAGGFAGFVFAWTLNFAFGLNLPVSNFVYLGMAGVMAGVIKAPLMAIFLTAEMTCTFEFLLPATVVCILSYGVVHLLPIDMRRLKKRDAVKGL